MDALPIRRAIPVRGYQIEPTSLDDLHHLIYRIAAIKRTLRVQLFGFRFTIGDTPDIPLMVEAMKLNVGDWVIKLHSIPPLIDAVLKRPIPRVVPPSYDRPDGFTALHAACINGNREMAEAELAANPAAIDEPETTQGNTPLMLAAFNWHSDLVAMLLERGADPHRTAHHGQTTLHQAAYGGSPETIRQLLDAGLGVDAPGKVGTPLFHAAHVGYYRAVEVLLEAGASIEKSAVDGETAIDAAWAGQSPATEKLLRKHKGE